MMDIRVFPSVVSGDMKAPASKSYTHRALFTALTADGTRIINPLRSSDTMASLDAVRALGAKVEEAGENAGEVLVQGTGGELRRPEAPIYAANSGTTLRFAAAFCALLPGETVLAGDESLSRRPNGPLLDSLAQLGAKARSVSGDGKAPLAINGPMTGGEAELYGGVSSQFLSALLLACPMCREPTRIEVKGVLRSAPYAEMTLEVLRLAGVEWQRDENIYSVMPGQRPRLARFEVPGDFSSAAYPMAAAAVTGGEVTVSGLPAGIQADAVILNVLSQMGCKVHYDGQKGRVKIMGGELCAVDVDASNFPDLVPTIAVLGAFARGTTRITNAEHARHKESDRLAGIAEQLRRMGVTVKETEDGLKIVGGKPRGAKLESRGDHRLAMALTVAALGAQGPSTVLGAECVEVSYAMFIDDMRRIGARLEVTA